jgi:hypothetical protein
VSKEETQEDVIKTVGREVQPGQDSAAGVGSSRAASHLVSLSFVLSLEVDSGCCRFSCTQMRGSRPRPPLPAVWTHGQWVMFTLCLDFLHRNFMYCTFNQVFNLLHFTYRKGFLTPEVKHQHFKLH